MNRFIEGGRLTDRHKNKIDTKQTLNRLNQIAKEKSMDRARYYSIPNRAQEEIDEQALLYALIDKYLENTDDIAESLEQLISDYASSRNIDIRWIEVY